MTDDAPKESPTTRDEAPLETASPDASTDEGSPSQAVAPATPESPKTKLGGWSTEAWGQGARAFALTFLLGMALVVFARLSLGGDWLQDYLRKNRMPMDQRMGMVLQMLLSGGLLSALSFGLVLFRRDQGKSAEEWERWAWFLSPLILLPAIPVSLAHEVWSGRHEAFLPVVLFGVLIAEVLFSHAFQSVPALAARWLERLTKEAPGQDGAPPARIQSFVKKHAALLVVVTLAVAFGAFMSFYTVRWHHKLGTAIFDLGINNNLLYGGLEGKFNQSAIIFPEDPQKYIANHVKIGLYTFLPIYVFYPKAETLLVIQSVSLGLGAIPLFLFLRRRLPQWWSAGLAISYLAYYPLHGATFYEMKLVPTSAAIVLLSIYAIDAKRWVLGGVTFVWAMIMREDMPVPLAVVGAFFLISGHRPRAGLLMAGGATIWFVLVRFVWMNEVGSWWFPNMYEDLWALPEQGFRSVIKTLVSNPTFTLEHIFVEKKFWYLMHLLVPLAFLPVRRWYTWAALVPGAILTLLVTDYAPPTMFSFQYVMHWAPYLYVTAGIVLASFIAEGEHGHAKAKAAVVAACLASAALSYNYGAFTLRDKSLQSGFHKITYDFSAKERAAYEDVKRLVAAVPPKATVGATERLGAHFSSRFGFYTLRRGSHGVEFIVARESELRLDRTKDTVRKALESGEYGLFARFGEFAAFRKGADPKGNEAIMKEWKLKAKAKRKPKGALRDREAEAEAAGEGGEMPPEPADEAEDQGATGE